MTAPVQAVRVVLLVFIGLSVISNVMHIAEHVDENWNVRAVNAMVQLGSQLPKGKTVFARPLLYFGLRHSQFTSDYMASWETIDRLAPDLIVDAGDETALTFTPKAQILSYPQDMKLDMPEWFERKYTLFEIITTPLGEFRVLKRSS